jgi:hypothetical protein
MKTLMDIIEAVFMLASQILLSGAAFKNEDDLHARINRLLRPTESALRRLRADKGYETVVSQRNIWNTSIVVLLVPLSVLWIAGFIQVVRQTWQHWAEWDEVTHLGSFVMLFLAIPFLFAAVVYAVLYPVAAALAWAREGGEQAKFVARLGVLCGVIGIICHVAVSIGF